jgi:hypothetical protein
MPWIEELTARISDEATRREVGEDLRRALRGDDRPEVPPFPKAWRFAPNVMFDPGDPLRQRLGWDSRVWATDKAYDDDLARFLGELACLENDAVHVAQGLARRALSGGDVNRLYAQRLAARLIGDDCPPAADLSDDVRNQLRQLAAR